MLVSIIEQRKIYKGKIKKGDKLLQMFPGSSDTQKGCIKFSFLQPFTGGPSQNVSFELNKGI